MGKSIKTIYSESLGVVGNIGNRLEEPDLEDKMNAEQLESLIENGNSAIVEKLSDYAEMRPTSRRTITEAFNLYIRRHKGSKIARAVNRKVQGILALTMLEALNE